MSLLDVEIVPVSNEPAYRSVVRRIETKIMSGEWAVGDRVPAETTLAQDLGVHRSTIREAIRVLEQNGLVRRHDGGKLLFVTAPREADISSKITAAIVLQEVTFFELWESMRCIEPALVEGAASRISEDTLDALQENVEKTRVAYADKKSLVQLDIEFHQLIATASGNRALQLCRQPISQLFYPAFLNVFSRLNAGERLVFAHEKILQALRSRDAAVAREWMDKHVVDFRRGYELASLDIDAPVGWPGKIDAA
ncbi:DNA-binding FadR family transcriptional regulator [Afipia massiliensis]|uniref:DNA-binding FadR family transcriptional regulator n=1 Tax=Afipia massiliensis TaxID=211460 RepID=A0A840N051_9BRAD|nr:FCD domain-containing protein [Afipia massiliensis]MBB5053889.1 DNA-binding FadR family transcriptional regulator [Afipia massiliensis]